jgi:hypothetical protein
LNDEDFDTGCKSNEDWVCDKCYNFISNTNYQQKSINHHGEVGSFSYDIDGGEKPVDYCMNEWAHGEDNVGFFYQMHSNNNHEICGRYGDDNGAKSAFKNKPWSVWFYSASDGAWKSRKAQDDGHKRVFVF